jgi:hypothetical protein
MEIRCVVGRPGVWEVVSRRGCCVFIWEDTSGVGTLHIEPHHCEACVAALHWYAFDRGYQVSETRRR